MEMKGTNCIAKIVETLEPEPLIVVPHLEMDAYRQVGAAYICNLEAARA